VAAGDLRELDRLIDGIVGDLLFQRGGNLLGADDGAGRRLLFSGRETEHEREQCQHAADYKLSLAVARKMNPKSRNE
jgi:hypothetical protein